MTYFNFLLLFVGAPILLIAGLLWFYRRRTSDGQFVLSHVGWGIGLHVLVAVIYTTPWDNYLVATGVWSYNPTLVTGIVFGYVPLEEYTFFVVQTILCGLWWWLLAKMIEPPAQAARTESVLVPWKANLILAGIIACAWVFFTQRFFFASDEWNYLGIIFFWALPPIILQLIFGADLLWRYRTLVALSVFIPGIYLSLADIVALRATTWQISESQTLGLRFFGILPVEEVSFFFVTTILVCFGLTLMLSIEGRKRISAVLAILRRS